MRLRGGIFAVLSLGLFIAPGAAADSKDPGVSISPIANKVSVTAGTPNSNYVTIGNRTSNEIHVRLSVKTFSVAPISYSYVFSPPGNDWIKLDKTEIVLKPSQSQKVLYDVETPKDAPPGGSYYTIVASTDVPGSAVSSTVQASSLLYLTVKGDLVRTSVLRNSSISHFVTTTKIDYKFDVENTGNVYFTANFFGKVESIFGGSPESVSTHLLMPGAPRTITGSVPSPTLPGIYQLTYGYKVDFANIVISESTLIVYMPPWSFVALLLIILSVIYGLQQRVKSKREKDS